MPVDQVNLSFSDGLLFSRMEKLIDGQVPAAAVFSGPYYFLEQLGFRKVIDSTFMMASMITGNPDSEDVKKYLAALRKGSATSTFGPSSTPITTKKAFPVRFHDVMDTRRWGPGERLVFEPYTKMVFEQSFKWIEQHGIFPRSDMGQGNYDSAIFSVAAE